MEIYLVRHGETNGNLAHRHQHDSTPLTFKGEAQAKEAAEQVAALAPTHLLTSNLLRAVETARIIGERCDLVPETSSLFVELERPKHLRGHSHFSLRSLWFYVRWYVGRVAVGEKYAELRTRIEAAKDHLATYAPDSRVVVVSHAVFITLFVGHLCRTRALRPCLAAAAFMRILTMRNGNMLRVRFDPQAEKGKCAWTVEEVTAKLT